MFGKPPKESGQPCTACWPGKAPLLGGCILHMHVEPMRSPIPNGYNLFESSRSSRNRIQFPPLACGERVSLVIVHIFKDVS
jgi:hypothetical protein